jgi:8-oxo-dGTP pyrophosphatase MutT (NUDIX family)
MITKSELQKLRQELKRGDKTSQDRLDAIHDHLKKFKKALVKDRSDELFVLVRSDGKSSQLTTPRWLCHLLGLRHRCAHVLLWWDSPQFGRTFILQVRSWAKSDSPGHLDISVGGHVKGNNSSEDTAYKEMKEELGIAKSDLMVRHLSYVGGYESFNSRENDNFYNAEWRDVYVGELTTRNLGKIQFKDKEVVGLYLCPNGQARKLLKQDKIPIASALDLSLPKCMKVGMKNMPNNGIQPTSLPKAEADASPLGRYKR